MNAAADKSTSGILIEAEDFANYGGWVLDSQFETQMGSPYLLAHGLGRPVADATTTITTQHGGTYEVWVRAKDWAPTYHPGTFKLSINGALGAANYDARVGETIVWSSAGAAKLFDIFVQAAP